MFQAVQSLADGAVDQDPEAIEDGLWEVRQLEPHGAPLVSSRLHTASGSTDLAQIGSIDRDHRWVRNYYPVPRKTPTFHVQYTHDAHAHVPYRWDEKDKSGQDWDVRWDREESDPRVAGNTVCSMRADGVRR